MISARPAMPDLMNGGASLSMILSSQVFFSLSISLQT